MVGAWNNGVFFEQGFVRNSSGTITSFSVPVLNNKQTDPMWINNRGTIAGEYQDARGVYHGFIH